MKLTCPLSADFSGPSPNEGAQQTPFCKQSPPGKYLRRKSWGQLRSRRWPYKEHLHRDFNQSKVKRFPGKRITFPACSYASPFLWGIGVVFFITYWATAGMPSPKIEAASARKLGPAKSPVCGWIIHGPTVLTAAQAAAGDSVTRPHRRRRAARRKGRTAPDDGRWMCHHGKNGTVTENDELWWVDGIYLAQMLISWDLMIQNGDSMVMLIVI